MARLYHSAIKIDKSQSYYDAWNAERQDTVTIQQIRHDLIEVQDWDRNFENKFYNEQQGKIETLRRKLSKRQSVLFKSYQSLHEAQMADFYFSDFNPPPLQTLITDINGQFEIQNPSSSEKVFAKFLAVDGTTNYFWLVNLPTRNNVLTLNNGNLFGVPN